MDSDIYVPADIVCQRASSLIELCKAMDETENQYVFAILLEYASKVVRSVNVDSQSNSLAGMEGNVIRGPWKAPNTEGENS